jgi:hypothetical protein
VQRLAIGAQPRQAIRLAERNLQAFAIGGGSNRRGADPIGSGGAALEPRLERRYEALTRKNSSSRPPTTSSVIRTMRMISLALSGTFSGSNTSTGSSWGISV